MTLAPDLDLNRNLRIRLKRKSKRKSKSKMKITSRKASGLRGAVTSGAFLRSTDVNRQEQTW
jgi:hypothetical protein